jgi:hypothetical protein
MNCAWCSPYGLRLHQAVQLYLARSYCIRYKSICSCGLLSSENAKNTLHYAPTLMDGDNAKNTLHYAPTLMDGDNAKNTLHYAPTLMDGDAVPERRMSSLLLPIITPNDPSTTCASAS